MIQAVGVGVVPQPRPGHRVDGFYMFDSLK